MSIDVTVGRNPYNIRRGKMVLSDLENIKKSEREHRRRLRSEQVREQSKAISKRILERTRQLEKEQLSRLEQNGNNELKKAHDRRLMGLHRRYQDIENIGYAHENALKQPDVEEIRKIEDEKNKTLAKARGAEAFQRLQESNKLTSLQSKRQQRLLEIRNLENERSCMVARLPKKSPIVNSRVQSSDNENLNKTASKRRVKCIISKKSPIKKLKEYKVPSREKKTPVVSVSVQKDDITEIPSAITICTDKSETSSVNKSLNFSDKVSDTIKPNKIQIYESDENEPRKTVPTISSSCSNPEILIRSNKESLQNHSSSELSSTCTTSSSSISDDSSYFSDTCKSSVIKKTPMHCRSPATSKIDLYDYKTRQRNAYDRPSGFVERMNVQNQPNADVLAQEMIKLENKKSETITSQKQNLQQRTRDALLRDKIRKDYQALLKNLDLLSKEEQKLKANNISNNRAQKVSHPIKNNEDHVRRQKKMDRAFQTILRSSDQGISDIFPERPITITPRNYIHSETIPATEWRLPSYIDEQQIEESCSDDDEFARKRKISELLLKIEKLKKNLLQEYGADLPDDIFNASVRSLFHDSTLKSQQLPHVTAKPKTGVSEIQVINMSSCDEATKPARKIINKNKKINTSRSSIRSTPKPSNDISISTRDKQIQVELEAAKMKDETTIKPAVNSVEPIITIVTPENSDISSSIYSDSSVAADLLVGVNEKEITVLPKARENSLKTSKNVISVSPNKSKKCAANKTPVKISFEQKSGSTAFEVAGLLIEANKKKITILPRRRRVASKSVLLSTVSGKSHSLPGSRDTSPEKKGSRSAPSSQQSSPKKCFGSQKAKLVEKQQINVEKQRYRTQYTQVSIDSSTESSQLNYTSEIATATGNNKLYRSFHTLTSKQTISKIQDSSDASTTYASPPAPTPGSMINNLTRSTPILELLNTSISEAMRQKVSPVSSPETPSPRTMKLPSNVQKSSKVNKTLKFSSTTSKKVQADSRNYRRCTVVDNSTTTNDIMLSQIIQTSQSQADTCKNSTCKNSTCKNSTSKSLHENAEDIQSFVINNYPEVLEKFEGLKNNCTERIAALTDSIQKLRNEERDSVSKIISNSQLSGNFKTTKFVNSMMDTIYSQLRKKLMESRKILSGEGIKSLKSPLTSSNPEKSPSISIDLSKEVTDTDSLDQDAEMLRNAEMMSSTAKPRVIADQRVNIKLDRFRLGSTAKHLDEADEGCKVPSETAKSQEIIAGASSKVSDRNEDMVVMLSKEILEQSKSINKSVAIDSLKDSDDFILKSSQLIKDDGESGENAATNNSESINLDTSVSDYIPLLAGIPKIQRTLTKGTVSARGRPPVTLISGPYSRTDIVSPAHELSTIVEFDTPDTANKSYISTKSPSTKCKKKLPTKEAAQSTSSPSKTEDAKLTKCKPSVHVAPLLAHRSPQRSSNRSSSMGADKPLRKPGEKSSELKKSRKAPKCELKNSSTSDSLHTLPDMHIEQLQQSQDNADGNNDFRVSEMSELHSLPDENIDRLLISDLQEESKSQSMKAAHKKNEKKGQLSLSDSTSFSGLSGVSEITTTPTSDLNLFKYPSSPEETELAFKKWGIPWAISILKKTREASALGSSSSSDVTPVNTAARLVSPIKKQQDVTAQDLPMISDVSSISIKHANKSTEQSVLVKGRTSTPNRLSNSNSNETVSTLGSFSSDLNIVIQNQSADITIPNISFSNDKHI